LAPDGSLYFGDWVSRSYPVHGLGRVWRLKLDASMANAPLPVNGMRTAEADRQAEINAVAAKAAPPTETKVDRLTTLQGLRVRGASADEAGLSRALRDANPDVRLYAVRWIADERLLQYRNGVAALLNGDIPDERYYLAVLGAVDWLAGEREARHSGIADGLLARELRNKQRSPATRALALRLISPRHKALTIDAMRRFLTSDTPALQREAVRTLAEQPQTDRQALLAAVAKNAQKPDALRADAVAGLARSAPRHAALLRTLAGDGPGATRREANRVLRLAKLEPSPPEEKPSAENLEAWLALLDEAPSDAESGRRLFHSVLGARCAACHRHSGRGGRIGPELTHIGAKLSRRRLVESILQPSREIAPQYQAWLLETDEGQVLTGLRLAKAGDNGVERYADSEGKEFTLESTQIDARYPSKASIMPAGLEQLVSVQDLRDLVTFLTGR
ncbi:MAG: hypothetical protein AAF589_02510, partial [Planctomycetota bacterium]